MATVLRSICIHRLLIVIAATVLVADVVPHPQLGPGLIETNIIQIQRLLQWVETAAARA